jgi:hypothetical protein
MDLLALSGPERKSYADQVVKGLQSLGARHFIFDHSVEEIRDNLHGLFGKQSQERHGPTADALRRRVVDEKYAKFVMQNTEHAVEESGIPIFRNPLSTLTVAQRVYFGDEDRKELFHMLVSQYANDKARDRDILSLEIVICRRQGAKTSKLFNYGHLLLTHNRVLSVISRKFMRDNKGYKFENVPPAIHIGTLFAALWLELGASERIEISRKKLVVACAEAAKIRPEIISRMRETLRKIVPEKANQFDAMMSQPRFMQMAMDATLGQENLVTSDRAVEAFDKLESKLVQEAQEKANLERATQKRAHTERLKDQEGKIESLEDALCVEARKREVAVKNIVAPRLRRIKLTARLLSAAILLIGVSLSIVGYARYEFLAFAVGLIFLAMGFLELSYAKLFGWLTNWGVRRVRRYLAGIGFQEEEARLKIDVSSGKITFDPVRPKLELTSPARK